MNLRVIISLLCLLVFTSKGAYADILVANGSEIRKMANDGTGASTFVSGATYGMYYDASAEKLYFTGTDNTIKRVNRDGSGLVTLFTGAGTMVFDLVVDHANSKLIWTDFDNHKIVAGNLDGSGDIQDLVRGVSSPAGIIIDQAAGYIYWAGFGEIQRAALDGTGATPIVVDPDGGQLSFLQIQSGKIYWSNYGSSKLKRANLDGSAIEVLQSAPDATGVEGLSYDSALDKLYFIGHPSGGVSLRRIDLSGNSLETFGNETGFDIISNFSGAEPTPTPFPTAAISSGFYYGVVGPGAGLYWSDLSFKPLPVVVDATTNNIAGIVQSSTQQRIYWANTLGNSSTIYRSRLDGTNVETFMTTGAPVYGMAIDELSGTLFYMNGSPQGAVYSGTFLAVNLEDGTSRTLGSHDSVSRGLFYRTDIEGLLYGSGLSTISWYSIGRDGGFDYDIGVLLNGPGSGATDESVRFITGIKPGLSSFLASTVRGVYTYFSSAGFTKVDLGSDVSPENITAIGARVLSGRSFNNPYLALIAMNDGRVKTLSGLNVNLGLQSTAYINYFTPSDIDLQAIRATPTPVPSGTPNTTSGHVDVDTLLDGDPSVPVIFVPLASVKSAASAAYNPDDAVHVSAVNDPDETIPCGATITDAHGDFSLTNLSPGTYTAYFDRLDVNFLVDRLDCIAGRSLPPILAEYKNPAPAGCTTANKIVSINTANKKAEAVIKYALKQAVKLNTLGKKKLSTAKARALAKLLSTHTAKIKTTYCGLVADSLALPEITLSCSAAAGCTKTSSQKSFKGMNKKVATLQKQVLAMFRSASSHVGRLPGGSVAPIISRATTLSQAAASKAAKLPNASFTCPQVE